MSTIPRSFLTILALLILAGCTTTPPGPATPVANPPAPQAGPGPAPAPVEPSASLPAAAPRTAPVPTPPPPLVEASRPPPAVAELAPATITGSEEPSTMLDNFTAFVAAIDGVPVAAGREGWNTPLPLKAGLRRLTLVFNRGVFSSRADVELNAESRAAYQVRFASDAELFGKNSYCEFWIVDAATNRPASSRVRAGLTRLTPAKNGG